MLTSSFSLPSNATDKPHFLKERIMESFIFPTLDHASPTHFVIRTLRLKPRNYYDIEHVRLLTFISFSSQLRGFSEYKPMDLFSRGLILGVKNKLRNDGLIFGDGKGVLFLGFYGIFSSSKNLMLVSKRVVMFYPFIIYFLWNSVREFLQSMPPMRDFGFESLHYNNYSG